MELKISSKDFRVAEGDKVDFEQMADDHPASIQVQDQYKKLLEARVVELSDQQKLLYARTHNSLIRSAGSARNTNATPLNGERRKATYATHKKGC